MNTTELIKAFVESGSFYASNEFAEKLTSKYDYFDEEDVNCIMEALFENDQVYRILGNKNVFELYKLIFQSVHLNKNQELVDSVKEKFESSFKNEDIDINSFDEFKLTAV